jgi:hypothetical protein
MKTATTFLMLLSMPILASAQAHLDWMTPVTSGEDHHAFTDLIHWQDAYYLCFRTGKSHGSMDGEIRVLRSTDTRAWEPAATLDTLGDDRDPHFVAQSGKLYVYFGVWNLVHGEGTQAPQRDTVRSHFAATTNGQDWSKVQGVYEPGWWLWRVRAHDEFLYSAAYTALRPVPDARETRLLRSKDGLEWELVSVVTRDYMAGEADFWWESDGSLSLLTRTEANARLFRSDPALATWNEGVELAGLVHAPVMAEWQGRRFVAGRDKEADGETVTRLWELQDSRLKPLFTLPSGGDTSYAGLIVDETSTDPALLVSWYASSLPADATVPAPVNSDVYVGRIPLANQAP